MDRWKRAVIHIECAGDSEYVHDRLKRIEALRQELAKGNITDDQFSKEISDRTRDIRYQGTAVFITHNGRRYLLTARHVLWDEVSAKRQYEIDSDRAQQWPENMRTSILQSAKENMLRTIFGIVFRVPSLDEVISSGGGTTPQFLMNLGAGVSLMAPYTFSSPDLDLAVVSLDQRDKAVADEIGSKGYEPISSSDIAEGPSGDGAQVYAVGFPSCESILGQISKHPAAAHWSSSYYSLPAFSFGRVSILHKALPFFWVDMSIYPGNSGGPVIEGDRLVGIVRGQPTIPVEKADQLEMRVPLGQIIKAEHVATLLSEQELKDSNTQRH
jgi:hypothetical protein